jgi:hypothetical protein
MPTYQVTKRVVAQHLAVAKAIKQHSRTRKTSSSRQKHQGRNEKSSDDMCLTSTSRETVNVYIQAVHTHPYTYIHICISNVDRCCHTHTHRGRPIYGLDVALPATVLCEEPLLSNKKDAAHRLELPSQSLQRLRALHAHCFSKIGQNTATTALTERPMFHPCGYIELVVCMGTRQHQTDSRAIFPPTFCGNSVCEHFAQSVGLLCESNSLVRTVLLVNPIQRWPAQWRPCRPAHLH